VTNTEEMISSELLASPTETMQQYLAYFEVGAHEFVSKLATAVRVWEQFSAPAVALESKRPELTWSAAYLLYAINAALVSTRLLLSGYLPASGNQARHALESMAFGVLLAFRDTGAYSEWSRGHTIEHKALERLARNAEHCGIDRKNAQILREQTQWFDVFSHPSKAALASIWQPGEGKGWNIGAIFTSEHLEQYGKEMTNRISLAQLIAHTIAGLRARLIEQGEMPNPI
jgi:hypothetical protein